MRIILMVLLLLAGQASASSDRVSFALHFPNHTDAELLILCEDVYVYFERKSLDENKIGKLRNYLLQRVAASVALYWLMEVNGEPDWDKIDALDTEIRNKLISGISGGKFLPKDFVRDCDAHTLTMTPYPTTKKVSGLDYLTFQIELHKKMLAVYGVD